jgi:hypothetical protein
MLNADPFIIGQVRSPALGALGLYTVTSIPSSVKYCFRILGITVSNMTSQKRLPPERQLKQQKAELLQFSQSFYILKINLLAIFQPAASGIRSLCLASVRLRLSTVCFTVYGRTQRIKRFVFLP